MWKSYASVLVAVCAGSIVSAVGCSSSSDTNGASEDASGMHMDGGMHADAMGGGMDMGGMGTAPTSVAIAPIASDAIFVINGGDSSISVLDPAMKQVVATIKLHDASFPHHIYASHDRTRLAVAVPGMDLSGGHSGHGGGMRGAVMVLDGKTGATKVSRLLDAMNHNAAFSPDDAEIWTTQMTMGGKVLILDASTLATKAMIAVGDMPAEVTFSPDGKRAFVANGMSNSVSVIDVATRSVVATVATGADPVVPGPGPDGRAYVDCEMGKSVAVVDPSTKSVTLTYQLGFTPGMAKPTPAGDLLLVTNGDDGKLVFNMLGMDMKLGEVATGAGAHGIDFSPDGKTAYVTNQGAASVSIVDLATRTTTATIPVGKKPNGLVYLAK